MNYRNYQNARDAAWRILLDCGICALPVDLNQICKRLGISVISYERAVQLLRDYGLEQASGQTDGMTFYRGNTPVILFNQSCGAARIRFTVAHELGHLILGHVQPGAYTCVNREPSGGDSPIERQANQFAARLLAPACVLWGLNVRSAEEIAAQCRISTQAAEFRAERMKTLYKRNKFLTSPLERQIYEQMRPFMEAHQNRE